MSARYFLGFLIVLVAGSQAMGLTMITVSQGMSREVPHWAHPETEEPAAIAVIVDYRSGSATPESARVIAVFTETVPVFAVFPETGEVWWSVEYFAGERVSPAGGTMTEEELAELEERRRQAQPWGFRMDDYRILLSRGPLAGDVAGEYLRALGRVGAFELSGESPPRGTDRLRLQAEHGGVFNSMAGPFGHYEPQPGVLPEWDEEAVFEENWGRVLASLFGLVPDADDSAVTQELTNLRPLRSHPVIDTANIRLRFPESGDAPVPPERTNEHVERAKAMGEADPAEAIEYLTARLDEIPEEEHYLYYAALAYLHLANDDTEAAMDAFRYLTHLRVQSHPMALADANIRMGYLSLRVGRDDDAIAHFARVAAGAAPGEQAQVEEAAYRFARLLHRRARRHNESGFAAAEAYSQLVENAVDAGRQRDARLQLSGLLLELAKGDFGAVGDEERTILFEQCRIECTFLMEDPEVDWQNRVGAESMYLQTFYYEEDFEVMTELAVEFVDKWTEWRDANPELVDWHINRQLVTAHTWGVLGAYRMGDYERCIALAREIRERYSAEDPFDAFNAFGYSLLYESFAQEALGNTAEAERLRQQCREEQPQWFRTIGQREIRRHAPDG